MSRPTVGITSYRERARWGLWDEPADVQFTLYADAVAAAGAVPLLLPPVDPDLAGDAVGALDGVIIAGGADVDPARYGAERSTRTGPPQDHRDAWELALTARALEREVPLLGICRGMQVLSVALGGTLVQHLPDVVGSDVHAPDPGAFARHDVRLAGGSRLGALLGERITVATHHHQAVDRLGDGLQPAGWADDDVVEAVELDRGGAPWVVGVQWHPEAYEGTQLFGGFVAECAARRGRDAGR
jgi:putative glutamine amidotransferase